MRQISILNFKGGVGKSTLSMNIGHALAMQGQHVLLIDCDLQGNSSTLLAQVNEPTLTQVLRGQAPLQAAIQNSRPHLDIVPSDRNLNKAANHIIGEGRRAYYTLRNAIRELKGYDIVFFDHSPNYNAVTETALLASSEMLIPCELAPFSVEGLLQMFDKLEETLVDHELEITGIVPFKLDRRQSMHTEYMKDLKESFGEKLLTAIRTDSAVSKAQSFHQTVFEYDPQSKAAEDFKTLATVLMNNGKTVQA